MGDNWLALDKLEHLIACALSTAFAWHMQPAGGARATARPLRSQRRRLALAAAFGFTVGVAKELIDASGLWPGGSGAASVRDLSADALGCLLAVACLAVSQPRRSPEALAPIAEAV